MPVEVTEAELRDALAVTEEWDDHGAGSARLAFESMGWPGSGSFLIRQYDVQMFLWYTLPRKFITDLAHKRAVAEALARSLERLGGRAVGYAAVCRSSETDTLLQAWEDENPDAWDGFRLMLARSGLEPPDTELLTWGKVMGLIEASAREQVITALEHAVEAGTAVPGTRGFQRVQAKVADDALLQPLDGGESETRIEAIHAERRADWYARGIARGGERRRAILRPISNLVDGPPPKIYSQAATAAVAPALWLMELGLDGIALTQTGAINRATVREAAERWTGWWDGRLHGPPHQEAELVLLAELHQQLRDLRLLRRSGRRLLTTGRGRNLVNEPVTLLLTFAHELLTGHDFHAACTELAVALLLSGFDADWSQPLAEAIQPGIIEAGWSSDGEPPDVRDISWTIADFIRPATATGLIEARTHGPYDRAPLAFTDAGHSALIAALRGRSVAPRTGPY